jgi:hypothetical protein
MKQNKGLITILGLITGFIGLLCLLLPILLGILAANSVSEDSAAASNLMQGTAVYQVPAGYGQMSFGIPFLLKGVMLGPADQQAGISMVVMQSPFLNDSNGEEFARGLHSKYKSTTLDVNWQAVGTTPVFINGKFVTMTVKDGSNSTGCRFHSVSAALDGANGKVILVASGLANQWDQAAFNELVRSIKY